MIKELKKLFGIGKYSLIENVEIVVRNSKNEVKKLFQPYRWAGFLIKHLGVQLPKNFLFGYQSTSLKFANLVTNVGFAGAASRINGADAEAAFTYLAVGIGTTGAAVGDTTLESEIVDSGLERAAGSASRVTTTETDDTAQLVKTWTVTGSKAVTEAGVLNAASTGTLLARQVFSAINVVSGDSLQLTYKIKAA